MFWRNKKNDDKIKELQQLLDNQRNANLALQLEVEKLTKMVERHKETAFERSQEDFLLSNRLRGDLLRAEEKMKSLEDRLRSYNELKEKYCIQSEILEMVGKVVNINVDYEGIEKDKLNG